MWELWKAVSISWRYLWTTPLADQHKFLLCGLKPCQGPASLWLLDFLWHSKESSCLCFLCFLCKGSKQNKHQSKQNDCSGNQGERSHYWVVRFYPYSQWWLNSIPHSVGIVFSKCPPIHCLYVCFCVLPLWCPSSVTSWHYCMLVRDLISLITCSLSRVSTLLSSHSFW